MLRAQKWLAWSLCVLLLATSIGANVSVHRCTRQDGQGCCHDRESISPPACCGAKSACCEGPRHQAAVENGPFRDPDIENGLCSGGCCQTVLVRMALDQLFFEKSSVKAVDATAIAPAMAKPTYSITAQKWAVARLSSYPALEDPPPIGGRKLRIRCCSWIC